MTAWFGWLYIIAGVALLALHYSTKAPTDPRLMTEAQAEQTVRTILKHPEGVRFLKVRFERFGGFTVLRPPSQFDYQPFIGRTKPPYARRSLWFWNFNQWGIDTRPRWLFRIEFERSWDDFRGRIIILNRVIWWGDHWGDTYTFGERQTFVTWRDTLIRYGQHELVYFLKKLGAPA